MSDADLRRQNRYTWMLIVFTAAVMLFLLQHTRATAEGESAKPAVTHAARLMIETGGNLR